MALQEKSTFAEELIHTKLALPRLRSPRLVRRALLNLLDQGLSSRLTLLSAGAGFGKTTLAGEWLQHLQQQPDGPCAAWVSLDSRDNDPRRFWQYFFTAVQSLDETAGRLALAHLEAAQAPPYEGVLATLINALEGSPKRNLLVLEDYHCITNPEIHSDVTFLLQHLPHTAHLVILTRSDPPLPLAYLRARGETNELRAGDLRFSEEEAREFLHSTVLHPLTALTVEQLFARTEGWPAGLRLASLALQRRADPTGQEAFLATFTGSHRPILDYLVEDVFAALPGEDQEFLLLTSFLNRISAPLCDAVTGRCDGAETLDRLVRANLFIEPLDGAGEWYGYQALFAEAMQFFARQRLDEARLGRAAEAASIWYEEQARRQKARADAFLSEAVEAALLSHAYDRAARLMVQCIQPRLTGNEYHTLLRWFQHLPEPVVAAHPDLTVMHAQALLFSEPYTSPELAARIDHLLGIGEAAWSAPGSEANLGEMTALRALMAARQGNYPRSFALAHQALQRLPEQSGRPTAIEWRAVCLNLVGWEAHLKGHLNAALPALIHARGLFQAARNIFGVLDSTQALGEVHAGRMEARQAAEFYRQVLAECEAAPLARPERLRRQGRALAGLARLAYDQDDLETAGQLAGQITRLAEEINGEELLVAGSLLQARIHCARGQAGTARDQLALLAARVKRPHLLREVQAWLSWLAVSAGEPGAVKRWAANQTGTDESTPFAVQERETLAACRALVLTGQASAAIPRLRSELNLLLLLAETLLAAGREAEAAGALRDAVLLAYPQGYRRIFLDEAEVVTAIGPQAAAGLEPRAADWAHEAGLPKRSEAEHPSARPISAPTPVEETLSGQEERILRLIGEGLSNEEIAEALVVSINTVKTHVKGIYRKLQVNNRRAARQAARHLPPE